MTMDDRDVLAGLLDEEHAGGMSRADVLKRGAATGAGIYGLSALFGAGTALAGMEARSLTPTFYQWIYGLYPDIPAKINKDYAKTHKLDAKIAPVQGFGIDRFVAEAKKKKSTWDVYVESNQTCHLLDFEVNGKALKWIPARPAVGQVESPQPAVDAGQALVGR